MKKATIILSCTALLGAALCVGLYVLIAEVSDLNFDDYDLL